jgi:acetylornithine deacetylase/succinyl-diaminopimelate desuccinylase-like protein
MSITLKSKRLLMDYLALDTSREDGKYYKDAVELLGHALEEIGFGNTIYSIPRKYASGRPDRYHLVSRLKVDDQLPTLLIYNHMDVVPADYDRAFEPYEKDGNVYARGASDHKGGTVAVVDALSKVSHASLRYNLIFWATCDEETSQLAQLDYMTQYLELPRNTVVFDTDTFFGGTTIARLGFANLAIIVHGKQAHSAMSNLGENAIESASTLIEYLKIIRRKFEEEESTYKAFKSSGLKRVVNRCNVTKISGGETLNVIPDRVDMIVNFRFIPEVDVERKLLSVKKKIKEFAQKEGLVISMQVNQLMRGYGAKSDAASRLNQIYKRYVPDSGLCCILGSCELVGWARTLGVPSFGLGVAAGDTGVHGRDEYARLSDMAILSQTLQQFLTF